MIITLVHCISSFLLLNMFAVISVFFLNFSHIILKDSLVERLENWSILVLYHLFICKFASLVPWPISHSRQWLWKKLKHGLDELNNAEVIVTQVQTDLFVYIEDARSLGGLSFTKHKYIAAFKRTRVSRK